MSDTATTRELIGRRRGQILVHRFLYYVLNVSLISDFEYDIWERELQALVEENPDIAATARYAEECPVGKVGSSNLDDYPRNLQCVAMSLAEYNPITNPEWWARVSAMMEELKARPAEIVPPPIDDGEQVGLFG